MGNDKVKALEAEIEKLTGKENKKARNTKSREIADLKKDADFVDAERVLAGKEPLAEHNKAKVEEKEEVKEEKKEEVADDKKKKEKAPKKEKKEESAGISPAERNELEELKKNLIARKTELKAQGMSGGQMNKEPQIVEWVKRMTELKEKAGEVVEKKKGKEKGKKGDSEAIAKLKQEIEDHKAKLKSEYGYTKSEINKDEDVVEMTKRLNAMKG